MNYDSTMLLKVILTIYEGKKVNSAIPIDTIVKKYYQTYSHNKMKKGEILRYEDIDVDDFYELNTNLHQLQNLGFIQIKVQQAYADKKDEKDSWIQNIKVIEKYLQDAYEMVNRIPKTVINQEIITLLKEGIQQAIYPWIRTFLTEELQYFQREKKLHTMYWKDLQDVKEILKMLVYIQGEKRSYIRQISQKLYQDSKYFENYVKNKFFNIVRKYEPNYLTHKENDEEMIESEILASFGILLYPQVFSMYGNLDIVYRDQTTLEVRCTHGAWYFDSDSLSQIEHISYYNVKSILLIENKANYIDYIRNHAKDDELVLYAEGHYSPQKEQFYKFIYTDTIPIFFWSDIDLGGFHMFVRMQKIYPNLIPYKMNTQTYEQYVLNGKPTKEDYEEKLKKLLMKHEYVIFHEVIHCILKHHKTIEQEAMIEEVNITNV